MAEQDKDGGMRKCFECGTLHMFLVKCYYYDLYKYHDGQSAERLICGKCLRRRLGLDKQGIVRIVVNAIRDFMKK